MVLNGARRRSPEGVPPLAHRFRQRLALGATAVAAVVLLTPLSSASAATSLSVTVLSAPAATTSFGATVAMLDSGNVVVTDPLASTDSLTHNGAVYLYDGSTHALISTLKGSHNEDQIGSGGVTALRNGNFAVASPLWDDGTSADVGAVTWGSGTTGITGTVSAVNSIVGSHAGDSVGGALPVALPSGAYVISSSLWDDGTNTDVGAITWASGLGTTVGVVSASNSLVGDHSNSKVGSGSTTVLSNGNFVVTSPDWNDGAGTVLGAATWGSGTASRSGVVSGSNSLLGSSTGDNVGSGGVVALTNGNYVVLSPSWNDGGTQDVGAATWGNGVAGTAGTVAAANSVIGSTTGDHVSSGGVVALTTGGYVVVSPEWDGSAADTGAATWGNGSTGTTGAVASGNSLIGSTANDQIGSGGVIALTNGHYVVGSPNWDGDATNTGAASWGSSTGSVHGPVSSGNSLVGKQANDSVGAADSITALSNGNYVVRSPLWDNDLVLDAGAVTWGTGTTGTNGFVATSNSLVGTRTNDLVGSGGVIALTNGNYVVGSSEWNDGTHTLSGAATWANGASALVATITSSNSLLGTHDNDRVGSRLLALTNGNYVVGSPDWNDGTNLGVGAATWGNGATGTFGAVSASNSLVGSQAGDHVSIGGLVRLVGGNYVVSSPNWANGTNVNAGAVTWGKGTTGVVGAVSASNSIIGSLAGDLIALSPPPRPTRLGGVSSESVTALAGNLIALPDGSYVFFSPQWNGGQGAFTWGRSDGSTKGIVASSNSIVPFCNCPNYRGLGGFDSETLRAALGNGSSTVWFATYGSQLPPNGANTGLLTLLGVGIAAAGAGLTWQMRRPRRIPIPVRVRRRRR